MFTYENYFYETDLEVVLHSFLVFLSVYTTNTNAYLFSWPQRKSTEHSPTLLTFEMSVRSWELMVMSFGDWSVDNSEPHPDDWRWLPGISSFLSVSIEKCSVLCHLCLLALFCKVSYQIMWFTAGNNRREGIV